MRPRAFPKWVRAKPPTGAGVLYKLDFPTGKSYIGITHKAVLFRLKGHMAAAERGSECAVHCAIRKYGRPVLSVLAIVHLSDLKKAEQNSVAVFGTMAPSGYNLTAGGESNPMYCEVTRRKYERKVAEYNTPEHREKLRAGFTGDNNPMRRPEIAAMFRGRKNPEHSARLKGRKRPDHSRLMSGEGNPMWGRTHSPEARQKLRVARTGSTATPEARAKMSAARKGRPHSPEHRAKLSEAHRRRALLLREAKNAC